VKILCVEGPSQYGMLNTFLGAFVATAVEEGHDVERRNVYEAVADKGRPVSDLVFSFGGVGAGYDWHAPLLTWIVDSPVFGKRLPLLRSDRDGMFVVCRRHARVAREFLGMRLPVGFMPHGTDVPAEPPAFSDADRPIDVLVAGSYQPEPSPTCTVDAHALVRTFDLLSTIAAQRWTAPMRDLEVSALFREAADAAGVRPDYGVHHGARPMLAWLDTELRLRRRAACVRALDRAGVRLHIAGSGWEQLGGLEHATLLGRLDHAALAALVRQAKVLCNVGPPLFNEGWHERVPLAMAGGALCVTEANDFVGGDPGISAVVDRFEMRDHEQLGDLVRGAIAAPDRHERTRAAWELARDQHTWASRARAILRSLEL
jgi:hypothetical protein